MPERRRSTRFHLHKHAIVFDAVTNQPLGELLDISIDGVRLLSGFLLPIGQNFHLKLKLDSKISDKPFLEVDALSIWCQPDSESGTYNTGFELLKMKPEEKDIIFRLANTYGFD